MENFKAHEEKMKAYQKAKKQKERPPRAESSSMQLDSANLAAQPSVKNLKIQNGSKETR